MTTLTNEQFERLLQAVNNSNSRPGSFSNCSARFSGERSCTKVEEFTAAISTFKSVEKINDADAISGMPMILEGDAEEWWRGVKSKAKTFDDIVCMLREAFSPPRPSWRIYVEIFENKQQKNESTDTFIRKKPALFSQLTNVPAEADQIDILFGLLHVQIRDRVNRPKISNFEELLNEAREAELFWQERKQNAANDGQHSSVSAQARCGYCRKKGHSMDVYFKKKNEEAKEAHVANIAQAVALKPKFACYG
ncbi:activity-regulated cytoskeleton associated protein 2-like [Rhagoletis pomonella]|uniref:activity-regulated cytoskeleton associated protein 2-like n=1 Tax=Rhagoletis pomonella TaxID=28610 RepID=UPI00177CC56A|nr:activity-regulated cytoskeleton associated protein 2-like [Rhagoletis pomonella]